MGWDVKQCARGVVFECGSTVKNGNWDPVTSGHSRDIALDDKAM